MNTPTVFLGEGLVCVSAAALSAGAALQFHELRVVHDVGTPARAEEGLELVRLVFASVASVDVVARQLRRVRWLLAHRCDGCGETLEAFTAGAPCPSCADGWSARLAEPGSPVARGRDFLETVRRLAEERRAARVERLG